MRIEDALKNAPIKYWIEKMLISHKDEVFTIEQVMTKLSLENNLNPPQSSVNSALGSLDKSYRWEGFGRGFYMYGHPDAIKKFVDALNKRDKKK